MRKFIRSLLKKDEKKCCCDIQIQEVREGEPEEKEAESTVKETTNDCSSDKQK